MPDSYSRIGVDLRDDIFYAARVLRGKGRPQVKALIRYKKEHLTKHPLLNSGKVILSVPENLAVVKRIKLGNGKVEDYKNRACFEILQSIPDNPSDYSCEILETGIDGIYMGVATPREILESSIINPFYSTAKLNEIPGAQVRGVALGRGYITFCHHQRGDLMALVDTNNRIISICFIYKRNIIGLAYLQADKIDFTTENGLESFAIELKTLINYNLNSIFNDNVTLPLSSLLITGLDSIEKALPILSKYFPVEIQEPQLNHGFFAEPERIAGVPLEKYLVALGLAIN